LPLSLDDRNRETQEYGNDDKSDELRRQVYRVNDNVRSFDNRKANEAIGHRDTNDLASAELGVKPA
jgi:hypothetical protein